MSFWRDLNRSQRIVFALMAVALAASVLLWVFYGHSHSVEYWNFRRCPRLGPAGPES